jgi:hypothetical protein
MKNFIKEYTPFILAAIVGCLLTIMFYRVKEDIQDITDKRHIFIVNGVEEYSFISTSENAGTTKYPNHILDSIIRNRYYYSEPKQSNIVVLGEGGSMRLAKPEDSSYLERNVIECDTLIVRVIKLKAEVSNINTSDLYKN